MPESMVFILFLCALSIAAQELNTATNGNEAEIIKKYIYAFSSVSLPAEPNSRFTIW